MRGRPGSWRKGQGHRLLIVLKGRVREDRMDGRTLLQGEREQQKTKKPWGWEDRKVLTSAHQDLNPSTGEDTCLGGGAPITLTLEGGDRRMPGTCWTAGLT